MSPLELLADQANLAIWGVMSAFLRVGAMMAVLPGLGERSIPMRVKLGLAIAFAVVVDAAIQDNRAAPPSVMVMIQEPFVGLLLGLSLRMFVFALQTAGTIAAQSTSLSQLLGAAGSDPMPALGHVLTLSGLTFLMITGFHVKAAQFLILSYHLFPFGTWPDPSWVGQWGTALTSRAFSIAFQLAAPFCLISLIYNLALGAINKAMPQLMVAFIGAPFITLSALALLALVAGPAIWHWTGLVDGFLANPLRPR
ncbi:flagellar biosynthetic protein FliR [Pseudoprimorskyibacter insulae]|uniref:Flagellar biosynthetic protein FliR n=1 Tax=Pseudoprimorskyibacter insulae TaxID=1695997 RepID=A0A2R8AYX0_9RHOB|nr:flagellar biosynthetic protein FliR [Pseudoprimorskyibacter insulae]SPF81222.1 hypothetical protein PRI8871_03044 [Pseudoprimorskyibacter insulae]